MNVKQVIVMRKDLNMRKGKMVAQGSHASLGVVLSMMQRIDMGEVDGIHAIVLRLIMSLDSPLDYWISTEFKKICVGVKSEEELMTIYEAAKTAELPCKLIEDRGHTEFHGVITKTCCAIGPDFTEEIDKITGHLPLL